MAQKQSSIAKTYDVSERVRELIPTEVVVSGRTFAIKRSGRVLRNILALSPEDDFETNEDGSFKVDSEGEKVQKIDPDEDIQLLYRSLAHLFVDQETGVEPDVEALLPPESERRQGVDYAETFAEWLEIEMDIDAAQELLSKLVPRRAEGNPTENGSA